MKRKLIVLLFIFTFASSCAIAERKTVKVGYYKDSAPFMNGNSEEDPKGGYCYEYLQYIASFTGWKYEYVYGDFSDLYEKLLSGEIDLLGDISYYEDRKNLFHYPDYPMGSESYYLYTAYPRDDIYSLDLSTLNGKSIRIGTDSYQKYEFNAWLEKEKSNGNIINMDVTEMKFEDVLEKDFDNGEFDVLLSMDTIAEQQWEPITKIRSTDIYLVVTKDRTDILNELNAVLYEIHMAEPYYNAKLWEKYYTSATSTRRLSKIEKEWFDKHEKIKVGIIRDDLPFAGYDEKTDEVTGLVRYFESVLHSSFDVKSEIEYVVFDRYQDANAALEKKEITAIFPYNYNIEYAEKKEMMLSKTFANNEFVFVYNSNYGDGSKDIVVAEYGKRAHAYAMENFPDSGKILCKDIDDCLKMVLNGEASGGVFSIYRFNRAIFGKKKYSNLKVISLPTQVSLSFCVNADDYPFISTTNKLLNYISSKDIAAKISYFSMDSKKYTTQDFLNDYFAVIATSAFVFLIAILALLATMDRLRFALDYDVLTKLMNRRKLAPYMHNAYLKACKKGEDFSIMIFDLDDFKKVNDTYGHAAGDEILKMAAGTILKGIRQCDRAFRWGGEEFLVLMKAEQHIVIEIAEKIRSEIGKQCVNFDSNKIQITATVGVSTYKKNSTLENMFLEADANLYKGKNSGKNQVVF